MLAFGQLLLLDFSRIMIFTGKIEFDHLCYVFTCSKIENNFNSILHWSKTEVIWWLGPPKLSRPRKSYLWQESIAFCNSKKLMWLYTTDFEGSTPSDVGPDFDNCLVGLGKHMKAPMFETQGMSRNDVLMPQCHWRDNLSGVWNPASFDFLYMIKIVTSVKYPWCTHVKWCVGWYRTIIFITICRDADVVIPSFNLSCNLEIPLSYMPLGRKRKWLMLFMSSHGMAGDEIHSSWVCPYPT